jgi:hypothetical protein
MISLNKKRKLVIQNLLNEKKKGFAYAKPFSKTDYTNPCAIIALATLTKPPILAPLT